MHFGEFPSEFYGDIMLKKELLLGDEAVALAAIDAGISGAYSYPGTPATEIFEFIAKYSEEKDIHAFWSSNEKVAYESALGMSFAGKRSIVSMKHVGLNVAADAFVNSAITGVHGGLVLVVADDPGMHSSQNEQDSRYLAHFALIPCLEPSNQQEAYEMTRYAFDLSEEQRLPVMIRLVTRLAHSRADVIPQQSCEQKPLDKTENTECFTLLPSNARVQYKKLTEKQPALLKLSENSDYNILNLSPSDKTKGIITNSVAYNYLREVFDGNVPFPVLRIGFYPIPSRKIRKFIESTDEVIVFEEGYPYIEEQIRGVACSKLEKIRGKLDGFFPRTGETTPAIAAEGFGLSPLNSVSSTIEDIPNRPPALCNGCPHIDAFFDIKEAVKNYEQPALFSDIGCYTLGFYPPYNAIESCVDMGASVSMSIGAAHAGMFPVICTIGDSTFAHSGMTGLLTAAKENLNMNVIILDNDTVAMTGTQETMATGDDLVKIILGLGIAPEHVNVFVPLAKHRKDNVKLLREEIEYPGLSVLISKRACVHIARKL